MLGISSHSFCAVGDTQTKECGHVPINLIYPTQSGCLCPAGHSLQIFGTQFVLVRLFLLGIGGASVMLLFNDKAFLAT